MSARFILSRYVEPVLEQTEDDKLPDGTFSGRIAAAPRVVAFASTLRGCELELRSTLEDWLLLRLGMGHAVPIIGGIDLNQEYSGVPVESV